MATALTEIVNGWSAHDLANLASLLRPNEKQATESTTPELIASMFKWEFHSRVAASVESGARNTWATISGRVSGKSVSQVAKEDLRETPSYDELIEGACKHLDSLESTASLKDHKLHLCQAVIIHSLVRMRPQERQRFFLEPVEPIELARLKEGESHPLRSPLTNMAALGLAQASGFGVYLASTTALGFVTHAVGITLPFAVYTGLSSTIAFIIGPAGWLGVSAWGAWKLMQPSWQTITRGLVYIICTNERRRLETT